VGSAPGKLVLLGEYAVLFGHPAVVVAVDRRARVDLRPAGSGVWSVVAPGYQDEPVGFDLDRRRGVVWGDPTAVASVRMALVESVIASLVVSERLDARTLSPAAIVVDTREFFQPTARGSMKLGLGSSAAVTVALTEALLRWSGEGSNLLDLGDLLDLHRSFQGGRGSGIDLAASRNGGVVEFRLTENARSPSARPIELPGELQLVFVWTGRSASTSGFLARLDTEIRSDAGAIAAAVTELGRVSTTGIGHIRAGEVGGLLADVDAFADAMERLGHAVGIPIFSDEHVALHRLARDCGLSYKPSGAGGGDVGIGFSNDPEAVAAFAQRAAAAGFPSLDLEIDPRGVTFHP
jgi:phosphomevalonate kinase